MKELFVRTPCLGQSQFLSLAGGKGLGQPRFVKKAVGSKEMGEEREWDQG